MMILGPRQPKNDIDVYLSSLIEDLRLLWDEGIEVFDAYEKVMSVWYRFDDPYSATWTWFC